MAGPMASPVYKCSQNRYFCHIARAQRPSGRFIFLINNDAMVVRRMLANLKTSSPCITGKYGDVGCCFQQMFNDFASGGPTAGAKTTVV